MELLLSFYLTLVWAGMYPLQRFHIHPSRARDTDIKSGTKPAAKERGRVDLSDSQSLLWDAKAVSRVPI